MNTRLKGGATAESWEAIYRAGDTGWDIGAAAPAFRDLCAQPPPWLTRGRLLVLGCGRGHDAALFAQNGFDVTAVDFAASAIREGRALYGDRFPTLKFVEADILRMPAEFDETFDAVLEHTCFCAIPPNLRPDYVRAVARLLRPGGILFGLFYRFDTEDGDGPPFCVSREGIEADFKGAFEIISWSTPARSHGQRAGRERLVVAKVHVRTGEAPVPP
jgi:methyl halide transferase